MRGRDRDAIAALRGALSAVANAEALPLDEPAAPVGRPVTSGRFAGTSLGVGSTEVERRTPTEAEVRVVVETEAAEREMAAEISDGVGRPERAGSLRAEAAVLRRVLGDRAAYQDGGGGGGVDPGGTTPPPSCGCCGGDAGAGGAPAPGGGGADAGGGGGAEAEAPGGGGGAAYPWPAPPGGGGAAGAGGLTVSGPI